MWKSLCDKVDEIIGPIWDSLARVLIDHIRPVRELLVVSIFFESYKWILIGILACFESLKQDLLIYIYIDAEKVGIMLKAPFFESCECHDLCLHDTVSEWRWCTIKRLIGSAEIHLKDIIGLDALEEF